VNVDRGENAGNRHGQIAPTIEKEILQSKKQLMSPSSHRARDRANVIEAGDTSAHRENIETRERE
jgi:hypothetical protein